MTISTTSIKNSYSGDNSTTVFNYTFKVSDEDEIQVIIRASTGTETVKTKTTHYTVSGVGNANGGSVTFQSGHVPTNTETVVLRRSTPQTQGLDLIENDPMPADNIETAYDKLTAISQELQEQVDRSLKISRTNTMTSTEFLTSATDRASKVLSFDSSGELSVAQELGTFRGDWAASTAYSIRDIVKDTSTNNIFIVTEAHTSSGSQPLTTNANSAKYSLIVDAASSTTAQTNAASSATAAASSATTATTKASEASTSATAAATSATAAASSATSASSSASTSTTKASEASTSATSAASSATAAASSAAAASAAANFEVLNDTTPQLGGDLDVNGKDIVSTSNADIDITPNGTGKTVFGGTNGIVLPSGTTAQRVNTTGVLRFNSTTGLAEYFDGTNYKSIDTPPVLSSVSPALIDSNSGSTTNVVLTGSNFASGATVLFIANSGSDVTPNSVTVDSATQITAAVTDSNFVNANEPYDVKVTSAGGLSATLADAVNVDTTVAWQTAAGSLGTINDNATGTHFTVSATDADSDTITYSVQSGSLPAGLSLNSSTGAISGDPDDVGSPTTSNFTLRASTPNATADRAYSIIVAPIITAEYLCVAGGGGGSDEFAGGGAGGYRTNRGGTAINLSSGQTYTVTVGAGASGSGEGQDGGDSSLSGSGITTITATGGGGGTRSQGNSGGSGAGGSAEGGSNNLAGAGNTPSTSPSQGNPGGNGANTPSGRRSGGGGGGIGGTGGAGSTGSASGSGGTANDITGSSVTYAGGGGGAGDIPSDNTRASGGSGGGGGSGGLDGTDGLGGGGGAFGRPTGTGGAGGDGVVILRLATSVYTGTTTGSPTVTTSGSDTIIKFTGSGSYTA